jgi:hypothetical protein
LQLLEYSFSVMWILKGKPMEIKGKNDAVCG